MTPHSSRTLVYRHTRATRVMHWVNALSVFIVLMSGLQIFNAHPRLHWGESGADADPALLQITAVHGSNNQLTGVVLLGHARLTTTGVLGVSADKRGAASVRAFPRWATIPGFQDLAGGRSWHFFFAWILVINSFIYLLVGLFSRHVQRDLLPARHELTFVLFMHEIWDHVRLRFARGEAARHYNLLQKLSYLFVIFILGPVMLATGLTMSPGMDAAAPWLLDVFGGRQSARTLHFVAAMLIALFILVHLLMVVLAGPINEIRSMITGRYALPESKSK
jgi:thiosulfate reductase cytochrome b subunit